ncbi:MAG: hypothetical protein ACTS22_02970 [Phycisphaerales bacterium]
MRGRLFGWVCLITAAAMLIAPPAWARQNAEQDAADAEARAFVGRQLARIALIDLRAQPQPGPDDAALAATLLQTAVELRPDDAFLLRLLIESRRAAGDDRGVMDATRALLRLDPDDEIALLRLIAWQISQRQTVEQRLAGYEFWLDGRGASELRDRPAVLSRLALDAALLHRELGDERAFVERLDQAATLDSTNKEAATIVATYFAERSDDPVGRLELTLNVLLADPVDPNLHESVATQLAQLEAFDQAARFHANARSLVARLGQAETPKMVMESIALRWQTAGPAALLEFFERQLDRTRREAAEARRMRQELGEPVDDIPEPREIRLTLEEERYRLFAALALQDRVAAERSIADIDASIDPVLDAISDRLAELRPDQEPERVALVGRAIEVTLESVTAKLVSGLEIESALRAFEEVERLYGAQLGAQLEVLRAFRVLREQGAETAEAYFAPIENRTVLAAVGSAMTAETLGDNARAAALYDRAARFAPLTGAGVFARSKAEQLLGGPLDPHPRRDDAVAVADAVPSWVDQVSRRPQSMVRLDARLVEPSIEAFGEAHLRLEIRNLLPRPVGVGGDRPIATRFALTPNLFAGAFPMAEGLSPEVVDIHHRLRLDPGESLIATVWPDAGMVGWVQEVKAAHRIRGRWNALQGFVAGQGVPYSTGPLSRSSETGLLTRRPDDRILLDGERLVREASSAQEARLLSLLPVFRSALIDIDRAGGPLADEQAEALARALAARYPGLAGTTRLAFAAVMPSGRIRPSLQPLDEALLAETDPAVLPAVLLTRVGSADAPILARCEASDDQRLASFARRLRLRLEAGVTAGFAFTPPPASHLPKRPDNSDAPATPRR